MKRYKMAAVWTNDGGQLVEHPEGDWVQYEDMAAALRVIERLLRVYENHDAKTAFILARQMVQAELTAPACPQCGRLDRHNCTRPDCEY